MPTKKTASAKAKTEFRCRVFVSDLHMGAEKASNCPYEYGWLDANEASNFGAFLAYLNGRPDVNEVILLGDTMDNWVWPIDQVPPTFTKILNAPQNAAVIAGLKALITGKKKVVYMPGNHDMQVTDDDLQRSIPGITFGGSAFSRSRFRTSRLLAEHGSAYAMFNAPDPFNDPRTHLPLGYFISRAAATKAARTGDAQRHWWTYADDLLEVLGPQKLPQAVFEAVMEESGIPESADFVMPPVAGTPVTISARTVKERYADLYEQWGSHHGKGMAFKAVMAEIGYLGDLADHLSRRGDTNIVIFGHSHDSELDKDSWLVEDRIYANCGAWCDESKPCSFVETYKDEERRTHHVRLMKWDQGKALQVKEESVDL